MYISEIDNLLEDTIDRIMLNWIYENKLKNLIEFKKIVSEINFVKHQKNINNSLTEIIYSINEDKFKSFITKEDNIYIIKNTISKYLLYYIFMMIGLNYAGTSNEFSTNLIDFSREQVKFDLKINGFFIPESNINIIKYVKFINEFSEYLSFIDDKKKESASKKFSTELMEFIKQMGDERIENFKELNKNKNQKIIFQHNVVKIIIFLFIYKNEEKKELFNTIEENEIPSGEYIFIEIVVPKDNFTDMNSIESILLPKEIRTSIVEILYNLLNDEQDDDIIKKRDYFLNSDFKIQDLFDKKCIVPIVDDFLLYHKNNEKYDNTENTNKKKDDTKLKFIVNKLNLVKEYYKNPKDIEKKFYQPMKSKNIVLVNEFENIKILQKLKKVINTNDENVVLTNELNKFRKYPYISFTDIEKNGFSFTSTKTLECIREVSFTQKKKNIPLQLRIMSDDNDANIVGFAIVNKSCNIHCANTSTFKNIYEVTNAPIDYVNNAILNKLTNKFFNTPDKTENIYWIFDEKKDNYTIPYYDISATMSKNDTIKILMSYFYDNMLKNLLNNFKNNIEPGKELGSYIDKLGDIKYSFPNIINDQYKIEYGNMTNDIYFNLTKNKDDLYDKKEDLFPGLFGDVILLPNRKEKKIKKTHEINILSDFPYEEKIEEENQSDNLNIREEILEDDEEEDNNKNDAISNSRVVCQHYIYWNNLSRLEKEKSTEYSKLVYEFGQQYIKVNNNMEYICKSCNSPLDIKRYIIDGSFDSQTQYFITQSIEVKVNIEELQEYEKYKTSIKNIEKIIERFASIFNISNLNGIGYSVRKNRKSLVKNVIDLVISNYSYLKKTYLNTRDNLIEKYGINKNLSDFFVFELDNNIFIYSSKEKDSYKLLKYNNILSYILIILILELNHSQIVSFNFDKFCNYEIFKKIQNILFDKINIIINKDGDIRPITGYPNLCYIIFMFSCFVTKYNLWGDVHTNENNTSKKFDANKQKRIINTVIEVLNTIIKADVDEMKKQRIYIYEILQNKYFSKLCLFKDVNLVSILDKMFLQEYNIKKEKVMVTDSNKFDIEPTIQHKFIIDDLHKTKIPYPNKRDKYAKFVNKIDFLKHVSNLTNCYDGQFHSFNFDKEKGEYVCTLCKKIGNISNYEENSVKPTSKKIMIYYINKLLEKYCKDGDTHQFIYDFKNDKAQCSKCKYTFGDKISLSEEELLKAYKKINNINILENLKINKTILQSKEKLISFSKEIGNILSKIVYKFDKNKNNINKSIDNFLDVIQQLLGTNILHNGDIYNLKYNTYIIDHDNTGQDIDTPEIIHENENKFREIENHHHFKRNVIVYTTQKARKYEIFYDLQEKFLLGYRETNKDYMNVPGRKKKLKIHYSVKNILLLFGFTRKIVNIRDFYPEIYGMSFEIFKDTFHNFDMNMFLNKISNRRLETIKNLGNELNRYIYRFKHNYNVKIEENVNYYDASENNSLDILYANYKRKINDEIIVNSQDKKHRFLKHNNILYKFLPYENINITNKNLDFSELISAEFILKYDFNSNLELNYILEDIIRLLSFNTNKHIKTNIAHFVIDLIIDLFNKTNFEVSKFNTEIKYFYQILYTSEFYLETQTTDFFVDALDFYNDDFDNENNQDTKSKNNKDDEDIETDDETGDSKDKTDDPDIIDGFDMENDEDDDNLDEADVSSEANI
jgi:hypothetical protein